MEIDALSPSPLARFLLELEQRRATGVLEVGGRWLTLHAGTLTAVSPAAGDPGFVAFLQAAERLTAEQAAELPPELIAEGGPGLDAEIVARDWVDRPTLRETRRALWLERFVRGVSSDEQAGAQLRALQPRTDPAGPYRVAILPFVLDALMRRAGFGDAERIGYHAGARFEWLRSDEQSPRALRWAELGNCDEPRPVSEVLLGHPGAASRIAALVRTGFARLLGSDAEVAPAPPPRPTPSIPPPANDRASQRPSRPRRPITARPLDPGQTLLAPLPYGLAPVEPWFSSSGVPLDDPLDAVERLVIASEQSLAPGPQRAAHWLEYSRVAESQYASIEEAARGAREAAAADPDAPHTHLAAARLCASQGRPALAYAYAKAAAARTQDAPAERAAVLSEVALYAMRCDKASSALRALQDACDAVDDGELWEHYARALHTRGDMDGAIGAARNSARARAKSDSVGALHVLAWASGLAPEQADLAAEYAALLAQQGNGEAAATTLLQAALACDQPRARQRLRLNAAQHAHEAGRPDVAADALLDVFADDPEADACHEPLIANLLAAGTGHEASLLAEEIAGVCAPAQRGGWSLRAAQIAAQHAGWAPRVRGLLVEALKHESSHREALSALDQLTDQEASPRILADALEALLRDKTLPKPLRRACVEPLAQAARKMEAPALQRWAWSVAFELDGTRLPPDQAATLADEEQARTDTIVALERESAQADPATRGPLLTQVAKYCRDDPQRRIHATKLFRQVLRDDPGSAPAAQALAELLWLRGDLHGLTQQSLQALSEAPVALLLGSAHAARASGEFEAVSQLCLALLEREPDHAEAHALLARAAHAGLPLPRLETVTSARMLGSRNPHQRARAALHLAQAKLGANDIMGAIDAAEAALEADPHAARAAELLSRHYVALDDARAIGLLGAARTALSDPPSLLWQLAQACGRISEREAQIDALIALVQQSEFLGGPAVELVRARSAGDDPEALATALEWALTPTRRTSGTAQAILEGLRRLAELGRSEVALTLALRAADAIGEGAERMLAWAEAQAQEDDLLRLRSACMERQVARLEGEPRSQRLRELARHEQVSERPAAEVRAWLRLLADAPNDDEALSRLAAIYAQAGDPERMLSVLTLRLEGSHEPDSRAEALMDMAAASLAVVGDAATAGDMVREALAAAQTSNDALLKRAIGLLLAREPQTAFDVLLELAANGERSDAGELYEEAIVIAESFLQRPNLAWRTAISALEQVPERTPLLVHFERLALEQGDAQVATQVYDDLVDKALGMHGRRALLYRKARWLERAGDDDAALDAYVAGFALAPSTGVVLTSIERLAAECDRYEALVDCLLELAPASALPERRAEIYSRAAALCAGVLGDGPRALGICLEALVAGGGDEVITQAAGIARQMREADADTAEQALAPWRSLLRERADDAWDVAGKVRNLVRLGSLEADSGSDEKLALGPADEALEALAADEDDMDEGQTRASSYAALAGLLARFDARRARALELCVRGLSYRADHPGLLALRNQLGSNEQAAPSTPRATAPGAGRTGFSSAPATRTGLAALPMPAREGEAQGAHGGQRVPEHEHAAGRGKVSAQPYAQARVGQNSIPVPGQVAWGAGTPEGNRRRQTNPGLGRGGTLPPPALDPLPEAPPVPPEGELAASTAALQPLCEAVLSGEVDAVGPLLSDVGNDAERAGAAVAVLLHAASEGRLSVAALEALAALGQRAGRSAVSHVAAEALSVGRPAASYADPHPATTGDALSETLTAARALPEHEAPLRILHLAWQHAAPLFRRTLQSYGATSEDALSARPGDPLHEAFSHACELTTAQAQLYAGREDDDRLLVTVTTPPSILVGDKLDVDPPALRHRFAACLERAQADAVLVTTLAPEIAESLVDALKAAFGPTSSSDSLEREAAAMAAELWRTIPPVVQRDLTALFRGLAQPLSRGPVALAVEQRAARVGLLASGHVAVSLRHAGGDNAFGSVTRSGAKLEEMLRAPLPRAVLQFALSEAYLRLREA